MRGDEVGTRIMTRNSSRKILVVEDEPRLHTIVAESLAERDLELSFVQTFSDAIQSMSERSFDAFLVDLGLPDGDGVRLIAEAQRLQPDAPSLVLTSTVIRRTVLEALRAGASGYLSKSDLLEKLPSALDEVLSGGMPISISAARYVLEHLQRRESPSHGELTPRERELLQLLARGLTYKECGKLLGVSINTVRTHIRAIYEKLHAANKAEAVMLAMKEGWI